MVPRSGKNAVIAVFNYVSSATHKLMGTFTEQGQLYCPMPSFTVMCAVQLHKSN
jgi:hypothetical protein